MTKVNNTLSNALQFESTGSKTQIPPEIKELIGDLAEQMTSIEATITPKKLKEAIKAAQRIKVDNVEQASQYLTTKLATPILDPELDRDRVNTVKGLKQSCDFIAGNPNHPEKPIIERELDSIGKESLRDINLLQYISRIPENNNEPKERLSKALSQQIIRAAFSQVLIDQDALQKYVVPEVEKMGASVINKMQKVLKENPDIKQDLNNFSTEALGNLKAADVCRAVNATGIESNILHVR